jgi:hypothetical protein
MYQGRAQDFKVVLLNPNNILMGVYVGAIHVSQENRALYRKLLVILAGNKLCKMNMMPYLGITLGAWCLIRKVQILLTANGYLKSRENQMVQLIDIKGGWWPKDISKGMDLITKIRLVQ